jgi:solute carrier family 25 carnitine/acylcarnitine transporter 20/29
MSIGWRDNVIAGSIAGCSSLTACHPFDVIRIHAQTNNRNVPIFTLIHEIMYINNNNTSNSIIRAISSLYKGFWGPFFAQGLYKSIIFSTNSLMGQYCFNQQKPTSFSIFTSGLVAGTVNCIVVSPVELIRTKQVISQSDKTKNSIYSLVHNIIFQSGIRSLYRNITPSILRDGPGVGFYFLSFNKSKSFMTNTITSKDNLKLGFL